MNILLSSLSASPLPQLSHSLHLSLLLTHNLSLSLSLPPFRSAVVVTFTQHKFRFRSSFVFRSDCNGSIRHIGRPKPTVTLVQQEKFGMLVICNESKLINGLKCGQPKKSFLHVETIELWSLLFLFILLFQCRACVVSPLSSSAASCTAQDEIESKWKMKKIVNFRGAVVTTSCWADCGISIIIVHESRVCSFVPFTFVQFPLWNSLCYQVFRHILRCIATVFPWIYYFNVIHRLCVVVDGNGRPRWLSPPIIRLINKFMRFAFILWFLMPMKGSVLFVIIASSFKNRSTICSACAQLNFDSKFISELLENLFLLIFLKCFIETEKSCG